MRGLTKNIGSSGYISNNKTSGRGDINKVLISRPNHRLGNLLLVTPLLEEISKTFPHCKIDLFVKGGVAPILFQEFRNVDRIIQLPRKPFKELLKYLQVWVSVKSRHYDLVINVDPKSSSGRLCTQVAHSTYKIYGGEEESTTSVQRQHIAKAPVLYLREFLKEFGFPTGEGPVPPLNLKLTDSERKKGRQIVQEIVKNQCRTICLFTYATGEKCYSKSWWESFYQRLKNEFPDYNFLEVLPVENISQINFDAPTFYSKEIREIGAVIAATDLFIGADSGIMHLASASQATVAGLFSRTSPEKYAPYNGPSVAFDTRTTDIDTIIPLLYEMVKRERSMDNQEKEIK